MLFVVDVLCQSHTVPMEGVGLVNYGPIHSYSLTFSSGVCLSEGWSGALVPDVSEQLFTVHV